MVQSYKQKNTAEERYDAILIGSGMGSLAAGAFLSKQGKKVLLLERHYTPGGFTHVFKRKGYEWDVGIHYIGDMDRKNSAMKRMFDYVSNGKLLWDDMGDVYDRVIIGDEEYEFVKGVEPFKNRLKEYFPNDAEAIDEYIDLVFKVNKAMGKFYMDKTLPNFATKLFSGFLRRDYLKFADKTTDSIIRALTNNEQLIKVLCAQYGDYGVSPKKSSFAMHAAVVKHYLNGGYFPRGGSSQIVATIDPVIESAGGTILTNAEVSEIIVESGKAKGVKMIDGKNFHSDLVISGAGVFNTYQYLLPTEISAQYKLDDQLKKVKPSVASGCLYIGLKGTPAELNLPKNNLWIYPKEGDHDSCLERYLKDMNEEFPLVYVSFPSSKDSTWTNRYPGTSTIDIITLLPYEAFAQWDGSKWMKRGDDYEEKKEQISARLFKELYKRLPQLEGKVDHYELSTPLSTKHFVNYQQGEIYGIEHTPERFRQKFLKPRTPIKGLYLTGQDIVTCGVGAAMFAGFITASAITGKNFMKEIFAESNTY